MKTFRLIPLLFLAACSTAPKVTLQPQPAAVDQAAARYPEVIRAYHIGRYADPNDDLVMHEQHVVYRVEENTRWDFRPGAIGNGFTPPRDAAFNPLPVNDAILAEVNAQRLATAQITAQAKTLSASLTQFQSAWQATRTNLQQTAALHALVNTLQKRLDALEAAPAQTAAAPASTTNAPADPWAP